jgi:hypothetical protein
MIRFLVLSLGLLLFFLLTEKSFSQSSFIIKTGPVFPTGNFPVNNPWNDEPEMADIGIGTGFQYGYQLKGSNLGLFIGTDAIFNWPNQDTRKTWQDYYPDATFDFSTAINIPVSTGLNYILRADKRFPLYGKAGFVANFLKLTNFTVQETGYEDYSEEYDLSKTMGYVVGLGISGNRINIEVNYMGLGKQKISGIWKEDYDSGPLEIVGKKTELFNVTLGIILN